MNVAARTAGLLGHTLVELLVAMTLVATVTAGGLSAFARANAAWRAQSNDQRRYERAQYVFGTLEPDLQMAGYFDGVRPEVLPPQAIPVPVRSCGIDIITRLDMPVERRNSLPAACVPRQRLAPDSDVLVVRRASAQQAAPRAGRAQWLTGDPATSGRVLWDVSVPPGAAAPVLRDLIVRIYYVARGADGDPTQPALRVKSLTEIAGRPAFIDTEVMPGVESLEVDLSPPAAPRSALVRLRVRADAADADARDAPRTLSITRRFAVRNPADAP